MVLPTLTTSKNSKEKYSITTAFLGVNKGMRIEENQFSDMHNMTNDYYPVFGNRKRRGVKDAITKPMGFCGGEKLSYVADNKLYYNDTFVMNLTANDKERQLVMMGAYLCVFPDGIVYNTKDGTHETVENTVTTSSTVTMQMCTLDGTNFTSSNTHIGTTAPSDTTQYPYWLDTSNDKDVILKMWSTTYSMWQSVASTYVKISATGIGVGFKDYDAVKFSGITIKGYNDYNFNDTLIVYKASDNYLIVAGLMNLLHTQSAAVTVKRTLPVMDFVCEYNNRIYGCRYGDNADGKFVNEIYACKLGDATNWNCFAGLVSDSYTASCGSEGDFTGAVAYAGYVFFFKEEGMHKLYGSQPSNFTIQWKPCRGVQKGSEKSIAIVNDILFYKARDAVIAFDGSENIISNDLGIEPYYEAVGVGYRNKYYISMRTLEREQSLFVYDVTKGTWIREDDFRADYMVYAKNSTYLINDEHVYIINNEHIYDYNFPSTTLYPCDTLYPGLVNDVPYENKIQWAFTTGDLGMDNPFSKYVKRINLRMQLDINTKVQIEVEYDSSGDWEYVTEHYANKKRSYEIPIQVRRADHIRLRLSGWGEFRLYSITRAVEGGSGEDESE